MADTHPLLQPFAPTASDPFDRVKAAHLLNRAGFGGTEEEIQKALKLGLGGAVDWLLSFPDKSAEEQNSADVPDLSPLKGPAGNFADLRRQLQGKTPEQRKELMKQIQMANREAFMATFAWWMKRMASGPHPLQEKLTLFWHGHFTTSFREERVALLIWEQNELLRKMAAGNFRKLLHAVSRDPAMLDYLNNNQNRKGHPNENFAREVMELFTLGIGNYTEDDVKEAARAFTGWTHQYDQFVFNRRQHDDGVKHVLGRNGNFNGDDVLNVILEKPVCARYIATKLYGWFATPDPRPELAEALGAEFRAGGFEIRPLLRTILTSRAFFEPASIGAQIKSPVQLVVGTVRMLGIEAPPPQMLFNGLQLMGQVPLMPPNVKGWPGGQTWINASTLFTRYNLGVRFAQGRLGLDDLEQGGREPEAVVDALVERLVQRPIDAGQRRTLLDAYREKARPGQSLRRVVQLIVSMPEYQLC